MQKLLKKVYIYTIGCHRRYLDARRIFNYFKINGYKIVKSPGEADYILFNTCAFKKEQEEFSLKKIQEFKKYGKKLIVGGCLPKINEKKLREIFEGPTFSPVSINQVDEIFNPKIKFENIADGNSLFGQIYFKNKPFIKDIFQFNWNFFNIFLDRLKKIIQKNYFIRVSNGCLGKCTYCGIRKAIGSLKSKPLQECLEEFKKGVSQGYRNFTILGDDTGSYGLDMGETFPNLLNKFIEIEGKYKIYIFELHPRWIIRYLDQLIPIVKSGKIYEIISPIQSGSDKILGLMQRFHTAKEIKEALLNLKTAFPKLRLINQIMIGFPGETEEDFEKTLKFIKEVKFDYVIICSYFERPNTPAILLPDKVLPEIIKERVKKAKKFLARL